MTSFSPHHYQAGNVQGGSSRTFAKWTRQPLTENSFPTYRHDELNAIYL